MCRCANGGRRPWLSTSSPRRKRETAAGWFYLFSIGMLPFLRIDVTMIPVETGIDHADDDRLRIGLDQHGAGVRSEQLTNADQSWVGTRRWGCVGPRRKLTALSPVNVIKPS